ncbi:hypothetical protein GCM10028895_52230 [Pontibacter rugosus]
MKSIPKQIKTTRHGEYDEMDADRMSGGRGTGFGLPLLGIEGYELGNLALAPTGAGLRAAHAADEPEKG